VGRSLGLPKLVNGKFRLKAFDIPVTIILEDRSVLTPSFLVTVARRCSKRSLIKINVRVRVRVRRCSKRFLIEINNYILP
jgi:hypothetical protein